MKTKVISLGGSLISPQGPDNEFLKKFRKTLLEWLNKSLQNQVVLITGGGSLARSYQESYKNFTENPLEITLDWLGIRATHLNAMLISTLFEKSVKVSLYEDYDNQDVNKSSQIIVAGGWKPGFSTDFCAVHLAKKLNSQTLINLSNISQVYTADPKKDPKAKPLKEISWHNFRSIVGHIWIPGGNFPFDPMASQKAQELNLKVIIASGNDLENLESILEDKPFKGTIVQD